MASSTIAQSSTLRQMGPSLSIVHESAIAPVRGTRPNVGRKPVVPQRVEGEEIEPSVSLPIEKPPGPQPLLTPGPPTIHWSPDPPSTDSSWRRQTRYHPARAHRA